MSNRHEQTFEQVYVGGATADQHEAIAAAEREERNAERRAKEAVYGPNIIEPQIGPQTEFLETLADIAVYGGAAGGGKTWGVLVEPLRFVDMPNFGGVIFRRTYPQIMNEGGLWDESESIYPEFDAKPVKSDASWTFPSGASMAFRHMQHEKDKNQWQGAQVPYIGFDELTHFTETQFFYMLSRNRSARCPIIPYVRATCNPDANSWVKVFLAPWVDEEFPVEDRAKSGEIRYFVRKDGQIKWVPKDYVTWIKGKPVRPKSVTFVRSSVYDNKILLDNDPEYLANLQSLPYVEQQRLLFGNWMVVETGNMFREEWFLQISTSLIPRRFKRLIRFWDLAGTKPSEVEKKKSDPDYTAGALLGIGYDGKYYMLDLVLERNTPSFIENLIVKTTQEDFDTYGTNRYEVWMEEEPGASGKFVIDAYQKTLRGFEFHGLKSTGSKIARATPFSAEIQNENVYAVTKPKPKWWTPFIGMATAFPSPEVHDDPVDAFSGAYNVINLPPDELVWRPHFKGVYGWGNGVAPNYANLSGGGRGSIGRRGGSVIRERPIGSRVIRVGRGGGNY